MKNCSFLISFFYMLWVTLEESLIVTLSRRCTPYFFFLAVLQNCVTDWCRLQIVGALLKAGLFFPGVNRKCLNGFSALMHSR